MGNSESNISDSWNTGSYINSSVLHILAMSLMLCDHLWAMLFPAQEWLTCVGRIAFPIFAFMVVEGYLHTHDMRRYLLRMLAGALLSEIPFNLMYAGGIFYPYHQNVLWTFLISLLLIILIEKCRARFRPALAALIPIWLYRGRQGFHNKAFQYFCYAFYPLHMLILFMIQEWMMSIS